MDFEESERVHVKVQSLVERELARLKEKIEDAAQRRDYTEAKLIKERLAHVASFEQKDVV